MVTDTSTRSSQQYDEDLDLRKYGLALKRRWLPAVVIFMLVSGGAVLATLSMPKVYKAEGKVLFKSDLTPSLTGLNQVLGKVENSNFKADPIDTQVEIVKSSSVLRGVARSLPQIKKQTLLKKLVVKPVKGTDLIQITYESRNPEEAATVVNRVIEAYRVENLASNREESVTARRFLEAQRPVTEAAVKKLERALQEFKQRNRIVALPEEAKNTIETLSTLSRDATQVRSQLADVNARLAEAQQQLKMGVQDSLDSTMLNQSEGVQTAVRELQVVQNEIAKESARYLETHAVMKELRQREANLTALLKGRVGQVTGKPAQVPVGNLQSGQLRQDLVKSYALLEMEQAGLTQRLQELVLAQQSYAKRASILPSLEKGEGELARQLTVAQSNYAKLLGQLQEARASETQAVGNVKVVSIAEVPDKASGPNRQLYIVGGVLIGGLLGLAAAFALDGLDGSVKDVREVEELFGYPVLGVVPRVKSRLQYRSQLHGVPSYEFLLIPPSDYSGLRNVYQIVLANLRSLKAEGDLKTLVVSSSVSSDGKSEVAVNLAMVWAEMGRRILLIDADIRSPRQPQPVLVAGSNGFSQVPGRKSSMRAIQNLGGNLDVLKVRESLSHPSEPLDFREMESLIKDCNRDYDVVILDVPPLVGCADASILGQMADGMLLVVPGTMSYTQGQAMKETATRSGQQVLGVVVHGSEDPLYSIPAIETGIQEQNGSLKQKSFRS